MSTGGDKARSGKVDAIGPRTLSPVMAKSWCTVKDSIFAAHCGLAYCSNAAR